jgi:hypothetical protein
LVAELAISQRQQLRQPDAVPIKLFGGMEDADQLKRYRDMG